jgi:hypothetical protein
MPDRKSAIEYKDIRPLGIGRLTSLVRSTASRPGFLIGCARGLFHLDNPKAKLQKIRKSHVGWIISGEDGLICYEETKGHGQLVFLDTDLNEKLADTGLARTLNPKAFFQSGIIHLNRGELAWLNPVSQERVSLAKIPPSRFLSPFAEVNNGYEFIAVEKSEHWPTGLYRLDLAGWREGNSKLVKVARFEDTILARHFLPLPGGDYLIVPQGQAVFLIYRLFDGKLPSLRTWTLIPIAGEAHPVGILLIGKMLYTVSGDCLLNYRLNDDIPDDG